MNTTRSTVTPLLAGIDAGTTRVRALLFTPEGEQVAEGSAATPLTRPQPGWAEHDPEALWQALVVALRQALAQVDDPHRVVGLACASMGEAGVPLNDRGVATFPAIAWFDERTRDQAEQLTTKIGTQRLFATTGLRPDPMFSVCKLLWLKQHQPEAYHSTTRWLHIADYLAWRLCGVAATDYSLASRTLALDLHDLSWSETLLGEADIDARLFAPLRASGSRLGTLSASAADATGLSRDCVVAVGGHDHIVGALAAGAFRGDSGTLLDSLGTAEALLLAQDQPVFDPRLPERGYSQGVLFVDKARFYLVAAITTSGACVEWFRQVIAKGASHEALIEAAETIPPGCHGVRFFPQMRLASPPACAAPARGAFLGLSPDSDEATLYRALLEGLAYDAGGALAGLADLADVAPVAQILATGGDSRNALLMRIKAAVLQRPLTVLDLSEAVSLGAALLGGLAAGVYRDLDQALAYIDHGDRRRIVDPDPTWQQHYATGLSDFRQLPPLLRALHQPTDAPI